MSTATDVSSNSVFPRAGGRDTGKKGKKRNLHRGSAFRKVVPRGYRREIPLFRVSHPPANREVTTTNPAETWRRITKSARFRHSVLPATPAAPRAVVSGTSDANDTRRFGGRPRPPPPSPSEKYTAHVLDVPHALRAGFATPLPSLRRSKSHFGKTNSRGGVRSLAPATQLEKWRHECVWGGNCGLASQGNSGRDKDKPAADTKLPDGVRVLQAVRLTVEKNRRRLGAIVGSPLRYSRERSGIAVFTAVF